MKTLGWMILHYGKPYLHAAIQALAPQVDAIVILYSEGPSQGHGTALPCPDTPQELNILAASGMAPGKPFVWNQGQWHNEGEHTGAIWSWAKGFDWLFRIDSDEIVPPGFVAEMIRQAAPRPEKAFRVPFRHFWRSFGRVVNVDGQMPVRLTRVEGGAGEAYLDDCNGTQFVYHMGYAQPTAYIRYKMEVSGHHDEWRPEWFAGKWLPNAQQDLHPVCRNFWDAQPFDRAGMPAPLQAHPYFNLEVIP